MSRTILCQDMQGEITLYGQLSFKPYCCRLPAPEGVKLRYEIQVLEGKVRFNHTAYNEDGGTWSCPPSGGQTAHYTLLPSDTPHIITLVVGSRWGHADQIEVVNPSMRRQVRFNFCCYVER